MQNQESGDGAAADALREALSACAAAGLSGLLRVAGDPGGTIHFAGGRVAAIETPGAPSPEVLLLRSHRVTESGWDAAFASAASAGGPMSTELVVREMIGAGELEALLRTALADAMFVLASGSVTGCQAEPGLADYVLPLYPALEPDGLLAEAARRIRVLAALPGPARTDRVVAAPAVVPPGVRLGEGQDEILALADGRRTSRDVAFALGRGVYATIVQLARMHRAGLLVTATERTAPRPAGEDAARAAAGDAQAGTLPRRQRDVPAMPRSPWAAGRAPELRAPLGMLRPRPGRDTGPGETS